MFQRLKGTKRETSEVLLQAVMFKSSHPVCSVEILFAAMCAFYCFTLKVHSNDSKNHAGLCCIS